jgi:hypothetical protein
MVVCPAVLWPGVMLIDRNDELAVLHANVMLLDVWLCALLCCGQV